MEMYLDARGLGTPITEDTPTEEVIAWTFDRFADQRMIMTSSFGMEGCALIDMYAKLDVPLTVVYLDTMFFFPETYALRDELVKRYPHISFANGGTRLTPEQQAAQHGVELWKNNPTLCCKLRKVDPMISVMADVDVWISRSRARIPPAVASRTRPLRRSTVVSARSRRVTSSGFARWNERSISVSKRTVAM